MPNPAYLASRVESEPIDNPSQASEEAIGTVRCQNVWKTQSTFQMSILRVNRQVYKEAYPIFRDENHWITFECNKAGFSKDMKASGFNVVYCGDTRHIENPVLQIAVFFPSLLERHEVDSCVLSCYGIHQFPRALWTAKGMEEMVLYIKLHPTVSKIPENEDGFMFLFKQLRGIEYAVVEGSPKYEESLPKEVTRPYKDAADIRIDLQVCIQQFKTFKEENRWTEAASHCESTIAFLADCYKVYGSQFIEDNDLVFNSIRSLTVQIAMDLAVAKLHVSDYQLGLKYARYALRITTDLSHNGFCLHLLHGLCLHLLLGQAYMGLKQYPKAMMALLNAQACNPTDSAIIQALSVLKKSLANDPKEALSKFEKLRITADRVQEAEEEALKKKKEEFISGKIVVRPYIVNEDGMTHVWDLRNGGKVIYKFAASDMKGLSACVGRLQSLNP